MANVSRVPVLSRTIVKAAGFSVTVGPRVLAVPNASHPVLNFRTYSKTSAGGFRNVVAAFEAKAAFPARPLPTADPSSGCPEVHCHNHGAELVVSEIGVALASLDYGNLNSSSARTSVPVQYGADITLSAQLVPLACGGFAGAWDSTHLVDGYSLCMTVDAWSRLARSGR